ncbi:segregation/condensation protein A [Cyanobium sp. CH-040]|uniref:segregation/condensation protein A n=1 Tax=Cyanobium sp. CH-040 TaxID=2823708 RepID=UPI0020CD216A|nr:segregation/condensation protein A [Cyanobium sp. CH-040]MCP9926771.1 segregation/condensation protein A [Cyanobium sp. CH-040]
MTQGGARLAIRLLQDAAERGEIDPWDVDVIAVVDGFLDQLRQRIALPRLVPPRPGHGGSYEQDLAESSEAFLAAAVLVSLKAQVLEASTLLPEPQADEDSHWAAEAAEDSWGFDPALALPRRPERYLRRRPVAPPPLQRPVTLGELIRQLEDIAEQLEREDGPGRPARRRRRFSEREAIEQVASLAHREKLPETTAALSRFLQHWPVAEDWVEFDTLVAAWRTSVVSGAGEEELDCDRVGVFWALLFLCHQGCLELDQRDGLFGPLSLRRQQQEPAAQLNPPAPVPLALSEGISQNGSAQAPAGERRAA